VTAQHPTFSLLLHGNLFASSVTKPEEIESIGDGGGKNSCVLSGRLVKVPVFLLHRLLFTTIVNENEPIKQRRTFNNIAIGVMQTIPQSILDTSCTNHTRLIALWSVSVHRKLRRIVSINAAAALVFPLSMMVGLEEMILFDL
jgi:hypothetical protein